jgi:alpha-tubulin suppressor-like RCC1 family protein
VAGIAGGMPRGRLASVLRLLAVLGVIAVCVSAGGAPRASAQASVMAWGENSDGQLGNGSFPGPEGCFVAYCSRTPVTVTGLGAVTALAGGSQGLALLGDGTVMAWGRNADGQLGNGSRERSDVPVPVPGLGDVTAIAVSYGISMALLSNGTVMDWGEDDNGQLGNGTTSEAVASPVQVSGLSEVTAIATGGSYGLALLRNGTVMAWGRGGGANNSDVPVQVGGLSGVTAIAADGGHSLALLSNGKVMAWGENEYGELGDGNTEDSQTPVPVKGLSEVGAIADGADHNLALLADGMVMAWGENDWGQLGDGFDSGEGAEPGPETCGPMSCSTIPVPVSGLRGVAAVATGYGQSLALLDDGTVMSWGENFEGQLANGSGETGSDAPAPVIGLSDATAIASGDAFSMAELHGETGYISGEVTSAASGEAIAGVDACATVANGAGSWRCVTTDASGNYTIAVHGSGAYEVRFWASPGSTYVSNEYYGGKRSPSEADVVSVQSGLTASGIDAQLAVGGRIEGTVTSAATKAPLEDVEVCAPTASSGCVLTNAKGEYVISGLQEGEYKVEFSVADGTYHSQYWDGKQSIGEGQLVPVAAGQAAAGVNAELEPASGAITGTVHDNETNSAIKGIGVCAYKVGAEEEEEEEEKLFGQCTTTNSTGAYSILGLAGGEYIVEFYSPAESKLLYATEYYDGKYSALNAKAVHVVDGEHTANIDAALEAGGNIAGKVTSAVDGSPIEGIEVCFFAYTKELVGCAITNAQGVYGTPLLARGTYRVEFTPPLGSDLNYVAQYFDGASASSAAQWVSVAVGATTSGIDAALAEGGRISGTVTQAATHTAIAGALVCALTPQARVDACSVTTNTGGYTIVGLAGGVYKVGFDGGEPYVVQYYDDKSAFAAAQTITVAVSDTTPGVDGALESADRSEEPGSTALAPVNTSPPVISGTDAVGEILTCADGLWTGTPTPTFSVRWLRDGSPIVGATSNSYTVLSVDEGHRLACEVTASSTAGEKSAVSAGVPIPTSSTAHGTTGGSATTSGATSTASTSPTAATAPVSDSRPSTSSIAILSSTLAVSGDSLLAHVRCGVGKACAGTVELLMQVAIKRHAGRRTISHEVMLVLARGSVSQAGDGENASVELHLTTVGKRRLVNVGRRRPVAAELRLAVPSSKTIARLVQIT